MIDLNALSGESSIDEEEMDMAYPLNILAWNYRCAGRFDFTKKL